jgi:hypothetical protein
MLVVFYVSGHGFGHATREVEIINAAARRRPDLRFIIRTSVPRWIFEASSLVPLDVQPLETDTGVVQIDGLRLDEEETARQAARFHRDFDARVAEEAAWLAASRASLVVGDIPPLAFAAAARAGVGSVAIGNFTWDWIYEGYPGFADAAPGVAALIRDAYARATRALRLPLHGGFAPMAAVTSDIALVARRSQRGRDAARRALGLGDRELVALASFGGYGLDLPYAEIARRGPFTLLVTPHETRDGAGGGGRLRRVTPQARRTGGLCYEDLVAAADVVVGKSGYGIVSECIANGTALLHAPRGRFVEQEVFLEKMPRVLRCRAIPEDDLRAGRWEDAIAAFLAQAPPPERLALDGADAAAAVIDSLARG